MLKVTLTKNELKPEAQPWVLDSITIRDLGPKGKKVVVAADILTVQIDGCEKVLKNRSGVSSITQKSK